MSSGGQGFTFRRRVYDLAAATQAAAGLAALRLDYTVVANSMQAPGQREERWWDITVTVPQSLRDERTG